MTPTRYPRTLVVLHWLIGLLVILMLIAGKVVLEDMPNSDPAKAQALLPHLVMAGVVLVLMAWRLILRLRGPVPPADNMLASLAHLALYVLIFLMLGSGVVMSASNDLPNIIFLGQGSLPERFEGLARSVHGLASGALILLILVHVGAAIWHMIRRDGVMARMSLRR